VFVTCFIILQCNTFIVICRFLSVNPVGQEKKQAVAQGYFFMRKKMNQSTQAVLGRTRRVRLEHDGSRQMVRHSPVV